VCPQFLQNSAGKCVALLLAISLFCSISRAQDVKVRYLPGSHLSNYHTYKWGKMSHSGPEDPAYRDVDQTVRRAVDRAMSQKQFKKVEENGAADLLILAQFAVQQKQQWAGLDPYITASSALVENPDEMTIEVGTVMLDIYSARLQLLWHGRAHRVFDEHDDSSTKQKSIEETLAKLMKDFPPE
jgi:hypothetical protein